MRAFSHLPIVSIAAAVCLCVPLAAAPPVVSSIMGLYPPRFVAQLADRGIAWFACATTLDEALAAQEAGADAIVAQGMEAGGHRGCFDAANAERELVGLFALLPAVVDAVKLPVVATGGIADGRGVAAALMLGASAAQIGTGFLRCPEAKLHPAHAAALATTNPENTMLSLAFSGRAYALRGEQLAHPLAVIDVHLAAEAFDFESLGIHLSPPIGEWWCDLKPSVSACWLTSPSVAMTLPFVVTAWREGIN